MRPEVIRPCPPEPAKRTTVIFTPWRAFLTAKSPPLDPPAEVGVNLGELGAGIVVREDAGEVLPGRERVGGVLLFHLFEGFQGHRQLLLLLHHLHGAHVAGAGGALSWRWGPGEPRRPTGVVGEYCPPVIP